LKTRQLIKISLAGNLDNRSDWNKEMFPFVQNYLSPDSIQKKGLIYQNALKKLSGGSTLK